MEIKAVNFDECVLDYHECVKRLSQIEDGNVSEIPSLILDQVQYAGGCEKPHMRETTHRNLLRRWSYGHSLEIIPTISFFSSSGLETRIEFPEPAWVWHSSPSLSHDLFEAQRRRANWYFENSKEFLLHGSDDYKKKLLFLKPKTRPSKLTNTRFIQTFSKGFFSETPLIKDGINVVDKQVMSVLQEMIMEK